jgi:hypothetical protein
MALTDPPVPGIYPGAGKATLINANEQVFLLNNQRFGAGTPGKASIAVQLERQKSAAYPFGFAIEITCSGVPGSSEFEIQGAETDTENSYVKMGTSVTTFNTGNVGRFEGVSLYPKFVRVNCKTLGNDVLVTALITR